MNRIIELLAPGGDVDSIKAAIAAGADAVYCGLNKFNARNRAANISFEELQGVIRLAHKSSCKVFLTLNIIILDSEIPALVRLLNRLMNTRIDGIIVQDLGLFYLLSNYFKGLGIHASTQLTTHNEGQIKFLGKLMATRVNLSRELNLSEITALTQVAHDHQILTEVFVHGSYCISFSGICYMSSVISGKSGNRGTCSQPCRDRYLTTEAGKDFPLNLKDNSAYFDLKELNNAGVDSLKIEGRIKEFEYVYTLVTAWKKQIREFYQHGGLIKDNSTLYKVFNRDFTNGFLKGAINKDMFIDDPMSHSTKHLSDIHSYTTDKKRMEGQIELYEEKAEIRNIIRDQIEQLSIEKAPLLISVSGKRGTPLVVSVKTPDTSFVIESNVPLANTGAQVLTDKMVLQRLKAINDTEYYIEQIDFEHLKSGLYFPFKELTSIKKRLLFILNDSRDDIAPVKVINPKNARKANITPILSVLISSLKDVSICQDTSSEFYFQLPNRINNECSELIKLFRSNTNIIPWFPSVIIGEDYTAAVEFLEQVQPKRIVTNNTGIGYEAYLKGIPWIAGPYLNTVNSFSLLCLKENFNCSGAFISNEINEFQITGIKRPEDFNLYYSIYHPIVLMTSRQCLFHPVTGCNKNIIDDTCITDCEKSASITDMKNASFFIEKTRGNYHGIFHENNFLNTDIVTDIPDLFHSFFIDLRDIQTKTQVKVDKSRLVELFENLLNRIPDASKEVHGSIHPSTNRQYKHGI